MRKKGFKLLSGLLTAMMLVGAMGPIPVKAAVDNGWEIVDGNHYWYENGVKQGCEGRGKEIYDPGSDAWYWLDAVDNGKMAVSKDVYQESLAGNWADRADGTGKWVRYDANGHMIKGWSTNENGTYYFDPIYGTMAKGYAVIDGNLYYFDKAFGVGNASGWEGINGWVVVESIDGNCYWYENGVRQGYDPNNSNYRGKEIYDPQSDAWYWLDNVDGGKKAVSKDVYQESAAGEWADREDGTGKWVRYDAQGHMIKGWSSNEKGTYYFDPIFGTMAKGLATIDGKQYEFDQATGILLREVESPVSSMTRGEWVAKLVDKLSYTLLDSQKDESGSVVYTYTDISGNAYAEKIEIARLYDIVPVSDGQDAKFDPNGKVTREFAAYTLVHALGFSAEKNLECSDASLLTYPMEAELAVSMEVLSLKENAFCPHETVRENDVDTIMGFVDEVLSQRTIDVNHVNELVYAENVVEELAEETNYKVVDDGGDTKLVLPQNDITKALVAGDILVLPKKEGVSDGLVLKVTGTTVENGEVKVSVEVPEDLLDVYESVDVQGQAYVDESNIKLADGVTMTIVDAGLKGAHFENRTELMQEAKTYEFDNLGIDGLEGGFSIKVPSIYYRLDYDKKGVNELYIELPNEIVVNGEFAKGKEGEKKLGEIPFELIPGVLSAKVNIMLVYGIDGKASIEFKFDNVMGVQYVNGRLIPIKNCYVTQTLEMEANGKIGCDVEVALTCFDEVREVWDDIKDFFTGDTEDDEEPAPLYNVGFEIGLDGTATLTSHMEINMKCVNLKMHLYLDIYVGEDSILGEGFDLKKRWQIWVEENSPFKPNLHLESRNGTSLKVVKECTYKPLVQLSNCTITLSNTSYTYDGTPKKPTVTVKHGDATISSNQYTVSYSDNVNAGTATVTITAKSDSTIVTGSSKKTFTIKEGSAGGSGSSGGESSSGGGASGDNDTDKDGRVSLLDCTVTLSQSSYTYDGTAKKPAVTVKNGSTTISSGEYTVSYSNNVEVGTATVIITAKTGSTIVTGSTTKTFTIKEDSSGGDDGSSGGDGSSGDEGSLGDDTTTDEDGKVLLTKCTVTLSPDTYVYDGTAKEPAVTVTNGGSTIDANEYTVYYSNNINAGTALVTIVAKENSSIISGTTTKNFMITEGSGGATGETVAVKYRGEQYGLTWIITEAGKLIVTGTCTEPDAIDWTTIEWVQYKDEIYSASMEFAGATHLTNLFYEYYYLGSVDVSKMDTANVVDMSGMFACCEEMYEIYFGDFDTSNVKNMSGMFGWCHTLSELDLSHFNTQNVTDMSGMFEYCNSLEKVDVSSFDTGNVTNMSRMFVCPLTEIDLSHFKTDNVVDMSGMFANYAGTSLDVSSFDTGNVTNMSSMFLLCENIESLDLNHFETGNVTDMNSMFWGCSFLTDLDISSFDTGKVTDMSYMFNCCTSITSLDLNHFDTGNVTNMRNMFSSCYGLTYLKIDNFETGKVTDMSSMFEDSNWFYSLDLSSFDTSNVVYMSAMFSDFNCRNGLDLSGFDTGNVTHMDNMFAGCGVLPVLDLTSFDTGNVVSMCQMFAYCYELKEILVGSKWSISDITDTREMFEGCGTTMVTPTAG